MNKHLLLALLIALCGNVAVFSRQPTLLSRLVDRLQNNPDDTAAWTALHVWCDTTSLLPEELSAELERSLRLLPSENNHRLRAELLRQNGIANMDRGAYQQSSEYLMKAIRLFESLEDDLGIAHTRTNLGALNYHLSQFPQAIAYWQQAARFFMKHGPPKRLGLIYSNIGSVFSQTGQLDSSEIYHLRALRIHEQARDQEGMAAVWNNLGVTYEYAERYDESLQCYRRAQALCDSLNNLEGMVRAMLNGATILTYRGKFSEALNINRQAMALLPKSRVKTLYRLAYLSQADIYSQLGQYKEAFDALNRYQLYKDSIINEENTRFTQGLQVLYETEKKEKEIALLSRESETQALRLERQRLLMAGLVAIALLFGALVWIVLHHQRRTNQILHNILPVAVASELRQTGRVLPKRHEAVTVLFADLEGFTQLGHSLPPETLVGLIDRYYQAFDTIAARHGIEKIKTIGDSYMCAAGLSAPDPQHAERMFRAATDMLHWVREHAPKGPVEHQHLQVRIGMHSGPVVAGVAGKSKYAYDIWGDTVNTAARMEQFGVPGRINLSESTRELLGERVTVEHREPVEVKGIGWVRMYLAGAE